MGATPNNMLGQLLEERVRETATEQAKAEAKLIEALIAAELEKIGVPPHLTGLWTFIDAIAAKRSDHLAQAKMYEIVERTIATDQAPAASSEAIEGLAQSIRPGDTLVLRYPAMLSGEQRVTIENYARANMAPGCNVLVLAGGLQLEAVLKAPEAAAEQPARETIGTLVVKVEAGEVAEVIDALSAQCAKLDAAFAALEKASATVGQRMSAAIADALAKVSTAS